MELLRSQYAKLHLTVNQTKSAVASVFGRKFLGYSLWAAPKGVIKFRVADKPMATFKQRIRQLTRRSGDILCEQHDRKVDNDNCVSFEGMTLQIPADEYRYHYVRTTVSVHRYVDDTLALFHRPRKLAAFDARGVPLQPKEVLRLAA